MRGHPVLKSGDGSEHRCGTIRSRDRDYGDPLQPLHNVTMANIASLLKSEISRVARKEVRGETVGLKKALSSYRSEIATLKRRAQALESELRRLSKAARKAAPAAAQGETSTRAPRFSAKGLASQRKRLGLSAHECGLLVGASGQSIYNWEDGKARPRAKHLQALAALRGMGKKDAAARLSELGAR
jgi:DNA-binding transcriptional regulator YiaG